MRRLAILLFLLSAAPAVAQETPATTVDDLDGTYSFRMHPDPRLHDTDWYRTDDVFGRGSRQADVTYFGTFEVDAGQVSVQRRASYLSCCTQIPQLSSSRGQSGYHVTNQEQSLSGPVSLGPSGRGNMTWNGAGLAWRFDGYIVELEYGAREDVHFAIVDGGRRLLLQLQVDVYATAHDGSRKRNKAVLVGEAYRQDDPCPAAISSFRRGRTGS